jgi:hypothetical protein
MGPSLAKTFICYAKDGYGEQLPCTVLAEQTIRPRMIGHSVIGHEWQWQYFIESQNQILVRRSKTTYEAIDEPDRVFRSTDRNQPPFVRA